MARKAELSADAALDAAFSQRDRYRSGTGGPRIGVFGNGLPEVLVAAAGAVPVHLNMGQTAGASTDGDSIADVIEPFVDEEVRIFLIRLMRGDFTDCRGIIFSRDDAPALIAYQYATEWVRQGLARTQVPPLFLWNLVHTSSGPVRCFNQVQAGKLFDFLESLGLVRPTEASVDAAVIHEQNRRNRLANLDSAVPGSVAMRWRNAGRFMPAQDHARLLGEALSVARRSETPAVRLGLVGSPLASDTAYALFERFGQIVADLQPWGSVWPGKLPAPSIEAILAATAADPFCPRITPTNAHRQALVAGIVAARCDLVICQLAQTDDTFGWEIPALSADLAAAGIGFVNLGFRDAEPDRGWLETSAALIGSVLEARA